MYLINRIIVFSIKNIQNKWFHRIEICHQELQKNQYHKKILLLLVCEKLKDNENEIRNLKYNKLTAFIILFTILILTIKKKAKEIAAFNVETVFQRHVC